MTSEQKKLADRAWRDANKERIAANNAEYRAANKEKISAQRAEYRRLHRGEIAERDRAWRLANKEVKAASDAEYRARNLDAIKEKQREYYYENRDGLLAKSKAYRDDNKDFLSLKASAKYQRTKDHVKARVKAWRRANPEKKRFYDDKRRAQKMTDGNAHTLEERRAKFAKWLNRCYYCGIGGKLGADHDIPLIRGGTDSIDNILPCCKSCNSKKGTRTAAEYLEKIGLPRLVGF